MVAVVRRTQCLHGSGVHRGEFRVVPLYEPVVNLGSIRPIETVVPKYTYNTPLRELVLFGGLIPGKPNQTNIIQAFEKATSQDAILSLWVEGVFGWSIDLVRPAGMTYKPP